MKTYLELITKALDSLAEEVTDYHKECVLEILEEEGRIDIEPDFDSQGHSNWMYELFEEIRFSLGFLTSSPEDLMNELRKDAEQYVKGLIEEDKYKEEEL